MGTYSSDQIQAGINDGSIVCIPFRTEQLELRSLVVHLGHYYYRTEQSGPTVAHAPHYAGDVERYFEGPFRALDHARQNGLSGLRAAAGLTEDRPVIMLEPGERIIAHTHEFLAVAGRMAARLQPISGWQQSGIIVTADLAGLAQVGRLRLIVQNINRRQHVLLPVGISIGRLAFSGPAPGTAASPAAPAFNSTVIDAAISTWTPSALIAPAVPLPAAATTAIEGLHYA